MNDGKNRNNHIKFGHNGVAASEYSDNARIRGINDDKQKMHI